MTAFRLQLRWLLTIWVLLVIPAFAPLTTLAYDAQGNYNLANDGKCESAVGYDVILEHSTSETRTGTAGYWVLAAESGEFLAAKGRTAYRVMSEAELTGAKVGKYADGPYMNPADYGKKWVWGTKEQAEGWKAVLEKGRDVPHVITEIPTKNSLSTYKVFDHGSRPSGPAYLVPFEELGPATQIR